MSPEETRTRVVEDATCLGCGCLCDDIALRVEGNRVVEVHRACDLGRAWFLADHAPSDRPLATIEGRSVGLEEALERAARLLSEARAPIVTGLTRTSIEAQAAAVALADRLGAAIDPIGGADALPRLRAFQRVGRVSATRGEVRNRADVIIFWGVDPITTHPRHLERDSADPVGRFVPGGRADRTLVVVDASETPTAARADRFVRLEPEKQLAALACLRAIVRGASLDADRVRVATGLPLEELVALADLLRSARYGAFFHGEGLGRAPGGSAAVEAAYALVQDLNESTRFVALTLGGPANAAGIEAVLGWQASAALACDFSRGFPRFLPGEATAAARLARGEADAALIVADPTDRLPVEARAHLARIPTVVIAPDADEPARGATVGLCSATTGIDAGGSVMRGDGVTLPLRPPLEAARPTDLELIESLAARLRAANRRA